MSRVLASKSQSKLGKDRMRLEANYMYKAEDKEREWEQQQMSTALLGEAIDPKSIQQQHNTNKKIPSHSGAPPLEFIRTSSRIFTGNNKRARGNILIPDLSHECGYY
jgi:hypothetical protein